MSKIIKIGQFFTELFNNTGTVFLRHGVEIMHPATLHMASESLLSCISPFLRHLRKESMTLNLTQRSFKVIHFGGNRKPVYDFIYRPLIVTFGLSSTVSEILPVYTP